MYSLLRNSRFYVLTSSIIFSLLIYLWAKIYTDDTTLQIIRLEQTYAFLSLIYLYLTLLASPLAYVFPDFPFQKQYVHARRALGVSVFYFALLHSSISFFGQLNGFTGISFFTDTFLPGLIIGFTALIILFLLTITSVDFAVRKLTFHKWKL